MKVGDLVKDSRGRIGLIAKKRKDEIAHWWVLWADGVSNTVHEHWLEVVCR